MFWSLFDLIMRSWELPFLVPLYLVLFVEVVCVILLSLCACLIGDCVTLLYQHNSSFHLSVDSGPYY